MKNYTEKDLEKADKELEEADLYMKDLESKKKPNTKSVLKATEDWKKKRGKYNTIYHSLHKSGKNKVEQGEQLSEQDKAGLTLKEQIRNAFPNMPDSHFDRHETDLYVKYSPELDKWLKENYEFYNIIVKFPSAIDHSLWFDIPFAEFSTKYGKVIKEEGGQTNDEIKTMADLRRKNAETGRFFFSPGAMRSFKSHIESGIIGGKYFITSEASHGEDSRQWTIRSFKQDGSVINDPFSKRFSSKESAKEFLKEELKKENKKEKGGSASNDGLVPQGTPPKYKKRDKKYYSYQNPDEAFEISHHRIDDFGDKGIMHHYKLSLKDKDGYSHSSKWIAEHTLSKVPLNEKTRFKEEGGEVYREIPELKNKKISATLDVDNKIILIKVDGKETKIVLDDELVDTWHSFKIGNKLYDINIWMDQEQLPFEKQYHISLYPVEKGQPITSQIHSIDDLEVRNYEKTAREYGTFQEGMEYKKGGEIKSKFREVKGTYGTNKTPATIFVADNSDGSTWYASEGSKGINKTYDTIKEGINIEKLQDEDFFSISNPIENLNDFKKAVEGSQYKKGGSVKEKENKGIDLFEDYENIPKNVQKILDKYEEGFVDGDYKILAKAKKELEAIGYTFEYYLDGQAYDLRKIGEMGKVEYAEKHNLMKKGGTVSPQKAEQILHDKKIRGKKLTNRQRKFFGARASGYPVKKTRKGLKKITSKKRTSVKSKE